MQQVLFLKIISGGQTGADRAALDFAISRQIPHGDWCPRGRLATDGVLSSHYLLLETESDGYRQRTKLNVRDSDTTLVFNRGALEGGTLQTVRFAHALNSHDCVVQLDEGDLHALKPRTVAICAYVRKRVRIRSDNGNKRPRIFASSEIFELEFHARVSFRFRREFRDRYTHGSPFLLA